ncbi:MAG TPA: hypothetical protein PKY59_05115 [Pyrinomonadaceae bacterium]|nr:hypothetical protein [Pyrinomonadaceae bacterium]
MKNLLSLALILCFGITVFGQTATAESTAKSFVEAWKTKNKKKIAELATPKIAKQQNLNYPPEKSEIYEFDGCSAEGTNWRCVWYLQGGEGGSGISLLVKKLGGKYKVTFFAVGDFEAM